MSITIKKRSGADEILQIDKIHKQLEFACEGIHNVSVSEIELRSELQFYNNMTTEEIQETLIKTAADLITEETPNYQYVASRLINFDLRKKVFGDTEPKSIYEIVKAGVAAGFYEPGLLDWYTESEWDSMNRMLRHERDFNIVYAGMEQFRRKYLVKNKITDQYYETPQMVYMLIAATAFNMEEKSKRLKLIKEFYNAVSNFDIGLPTAILAGVRTPIRQFSNCTLIDVGDSLDSINAAASSIVKYASKRAGIGFNVGRLRAIGSPIRNGEVTHTGVLPFIKYLTAALKSCNQGGIRNASATCNFPMWHYEYEDLVVLKNNKGVEEARNRSIDYVIQINQVLLQRLIDGKDITLFSPSDVPDLYEAFFRSNAEFEYLYNKYEKDKSIRHRKISALEAFSQLILERKETGRIYIQFVDNTNEHGAYDSSKQIITMTNLCVEITPITKPLDDVNDPNGIVSLCTLASYNLGNVKTPSDFERMSSILVRFLDNILTYQDYLLPAAKHSTDLYRNIGIGLTNLAYFLAKHNQKYTDESTTEFLAPFFEAYSYYTIKASMELAKERGACLGIDDTKWKQGLTPVDTYRKTLDEYTKNDLLLDWNQLKSDLKEFGVRNANLMAQMPNETNSQVINSTNGIEPPRSLVSVKSSKDGALKQVVPEISRLKKRYELLWDQKSPEGYLKICGLLTKFIDQSISTNTSYNPEFYEDKIIPMSVLIKDLITAYRMGIKTLYYHQENDMAGEIEIKAEVPIFVESTDSLEDEFCESCAI
jgi:ribonucleoside-diphosphate reductase alpha chain